MKSSRPGFCFMERLIITNSFVDQLRSFFLFLQFMSTYICPFHLCCLIFGRNLFIKFPFRPFNFYRIGNDISSFVTHLDTFLCSTFLSV